MVDPGWMKRTAILTAVLALPAITLLAYIRVKTRHSWASEAWNVSFRTAILILIVYFAWVLNALFGLSGGFLVAWPMLGIPLSLFGAVASRWGIQGQRGELAAANLLLLLLHLASVISPN